MALMLNKLERVRKRGQRVHARCPACAEAGGDTHGQHLAIDEQGRFGCAAHPGDNSHRRRIWELAGDGEKLRSIRPSIRPIAIRNAWSSPDASDGAFRIRAPSRNLTEQVPDVSDGIFYPLRLLNKPLYIPNIADHPSEPSDGRPRANSENLDSLFQPSLIGANLLVPLDSPFREGQRYRWVAVALVDRLDVYVADEVGPWIRRHGVLIAVEPEHT